MQQEVVLSHISDDQIPPLKAHPEVRVRHTGTEWSGSRLAERLQS